jgi:hypothetical protein
MKWLADIEEVGIDREISNDPQHAIWFSFNVRLIKRRAGVHHLIFHQGHYSQPPNGVPVSDASQATWRPPDRKRRWNKANLENRRISDSFP